jgi:hypothetical protein
MTLLHDALRAAHRTVPVAATRTRRVLVAGGGGALGAGVVEELLASERFAQVAVLVTHPVNVALRGLATLSEDDLRSATRAPEDLAMVVFDRPRHANGREAAFLRPDPVTLPSLASRLRTRGVRDLVMVMPHAPASLPDALKHGLATLDEQAVAALAFDHLLILRPAHAVTRIRADNAAQRLADWVLSQLHYMVPQRDKPVRAAKVARFVVALAARLPQAAGGTRVVPPEVVWEAAQAPDMDAFAAQWLK